MKNKTDVRAVCGIHLSLLSMNIAKLGKDDPDFRLEFQKYWDAFRYENDTLRDIQVYFDVSRCCPVSSATMWDIRRPRDLLLCGRTSDVEAGVLNYMLDTTRPGYESPVSAQHDVETGKDSWTRAREEIGSVAADECEHHGILDRFGEPSELDKQYMKLAAHTESTRLLGLTLLSTGPEYYEQALAQFTAASHDWVRRLDPMLQAHRVTVELKIASENAGNSKCKAREESSSTRECPCSACSGRGVLDAFKLWVECDPYLVHAARQSPLPSRGSSQYPSTCSSPPLVFGCSDVACSTPARREMHTEAA